MLWLVNIVAFLINAVIVGLSTLGVWGETNATVSDDNPTLVTPASYAFSIWGVIFLSELIFVIWQALSRNRDSDIITKGIGFWFAAACIFQAAWSIVFAQEELVASAVILLLIAFCLAMAVVGLAPYKREKTLLFCSVEFWTVHFPIGLHGGWVLAASLVNINVALDDPSLTAQVAGLVLTVVAASVGATLAAVVFYDQVYLLSIAWALAAVASKEDDRTTLLGAEISDGVHDGITGLWIALLVLGAITALAGMVMGRGGGGTDAGYSGRPAWSHGGRKPHRNANDGPQTDVTSAIYHA
ncbi:unnamed protein product [Sphacelaria rigidula]